MFGVFFFFLKIKKIISYALNLNVIEESLKIDENRRKRIYSTNTLIP